MGHKKPRRPRLYKQRTLPSDPESLIAMIRAVERKLRAVAEHWKAEPKDYRAKGRFQRLHDERARAYNSLRLMDQTAFEALMKEFNHSLAHQVSS